MDLATHNELFDFRYRVISLAGQGAMGQVYRAFDCWNNDLQVALKILFPQAVSYQKLLKQEIGAIRQLRHPSIARILSGGYDDVNHVAYVVSEWAEGIDASQFDWTNRNDKLRHFVVSLLRTLVYIHSHGIIHHDLKPSNCRVFETGETLQLKLLDFGLAGRKRKRKNVRGTVDYLPPEQWRSPFASPAVDLYALGIMLYQCATGHVPYPEISPVQSVRKRGETPLPDARQDAPWLGTDIAELISHLTDPNPNYRPASANDALSFLRDHPQKTLIVDEDFSHYLEFLTPNPVIENLLTSQVESDSQTTNTVIISGELYNCDAEKQLQHWLLELVYNGITTGYITGESDEGFVRNWFLAHRIHSSKIVLIEYPKISSEPDEVDNKSIKIKFENGNGSEKVSQHENTILISPSNFIETKAVVKNLLPGLQAPDAWFQKIYFMSGGYGRLVKKRLCEEFAQGTLVQNGYGWSVQPFEPTLKLTEDLGSIYKNQLQELSADELLFINTLSLFPHGIPLEWILQFTGLPSSIWSKIATNPMFLSHNGDNPTIEIAFPAFRYMIFGQLERKFIEKIYKQILELKKNLADETWILSAAIHCGTALADKSGVAEHLTQWIKKPNRERLHYETISALSMWIDDTSVPNELRAMIGLRWGYNLTLLGNAKDAEEVYESVHNLPDISYKIRISIRINLATLLLQKGQTERAKELFTSVLKEATAESQLDQMSSALSSLSWIAAMSQEWQAAEELSRQSLSITHSNDNTFERYRALNVKAMYEYFIKHNLDSASKTWTSCLHIADKLGNQTLQCDTLNNLGVIAALKGKNSVASRYWNRTIEIARAADYRPRLSAALVNVGIKRFEAGRLDEALVAYEQGLRLFQHSERLDYQIDCLMNRSELNICRALYTDALNDNERARSLAEKTNDPDHLLQTSFQYSELLFMVGDRVSAIQTLDNSDRYLADASPQTGLRSQILRSRLTGSERGQTNPLFSGSNNKDDSDDPIEEARSLFLTLYSNSKIERNVASILSERLFSIGTENNHDWYHSWGVFFRYYYSAEEKTSNDWDAILHGNKKYPELYWRISWQMGKALMVEGQKEQGKIVYRKALNTLKSIGANLNKVMNESYFEQEDQRIFRTDVLSTNK